MPRIGAGRLINRIGKARPGRNSTIALAGLGALAGVSTSRLSEKSFDMYSEAMLGDAQVDRAILGTDIGWGTMMGFDPNPIHHIGLPPLQFINPTIMGDAFADDAKDTAAERLAESNFRAGANRSSVPNSIYEYQAAVQRTGTAANEDYYGYDFPAPVTRRQRRDYGATGDIVFGAYNMRLG